MKKNRPTLVFKIYIVLLTIIVCETILLVWLYLKPRLPSGNSDNDVASQYIQEDNIIQKAYPDVDFSKIYPDLSLKEIDQLQRECYNIRYVYCPFVQFEPLPVSKGFVEITRAGYRKGRKNQPWPPRKDDFVVFVFGGSTTFCYSLQNERSLVSILEEELSKIYTDHNVECYNFGRGFYFSTQEKLLFESLLMQERVPDLAIFVDGLNDYYYANGTPESTSELYHFFAPDLPYVAPIEYKNEKERAVAVKMILGRYKQNVRMIEAVAKAYNISVIFVGQPVPFLNFPRNQQTYPFKIAHVGHELCQWGYGKFEEAALKGDFGDHFIWCGDAFSRATSIMYADSIHYSYDGAKIFAHSIISKATDAGLLPATDKHH